MKAIVLESKNRFKLVKVPIPEIEENEVLIKIESCGLCGTDIEIYDGVIPVEFPLIIGHEFAGVVEKTGKKVKKFKEGDPVTANPATGCGECEYCQKGQENLCATFPRYPGFRSDASGAFAEYIKMKENSLYHLSPPVDLETASLIEPLSCCIHGLDIAEVKVGDSAIIFGAGTIGLLMTQLLRISGTSKITVIEKKDKRRKVASLLGADITLKKLTVNKTKLIDNIFEGKAEVVLECTGNSQTQQEALSLVKPGGKVVWFGVADPQTEIKVNSFDIYRNEITIRGVFANPYTTSRAIQVLSKGQIKTKELITHRFGLSDFGAAIETYKKDDKRIKILIKPAT